MPRSRQKAEKAALYVRVSTRMQVDKDSLPFQRKKLKEYCKLLEIPKFTIYEDDGYSAKNTDRPEFQNMMDAARRGEFSHLIVWKVDRISRNLLDFATMYAELKAHRITFISMNEQFDTSTAIGEAMLKIILIFAELERKMCSERVTGVMLDRAEKGLYNGSRLPLGYDVDPETRTFTPDPDEKEIVKLIFDHYEKTHSCQKVARFLQQSGFEPKYHDEWIPQAILRILRNETYIGTYTYNRREYNGPEKPEAEWIVIPDNHPAIISKDQFERCAAILDENAATRDVSKIRNTKHIHVFGNGKCVCGLCGNKMAAMKDKPRANGLSPSVYRCSRRARQLDCENRRMISDISLGPFVFTYAANLARIQKDRSGIDSTDALEAALLKGDCFSGVRIAPESLEKTFSLLSHKDIGKGRFSPDTGEAEADPVPNAADRIAALEKEKEKCRTAISRLTDLYMFDPDSMTKEEFSERKRETTKRIREITKQIAALKDGAGHGSADLAFIRKASAFLVARHITKGDVDFCQLLADLDTAVLKDFVDQIIGAITVTDGRISRIRFVSGLEHDFIYEE